jgi:WD40 repeat protein
LAGVKSISVTFSSGGTLVGSSKLGAAIWNLKSGDSCSMAQAAYEPFTSFAFSPDGKRVAIGSAGKTVRLCDTSTGQEMLCLSGFSDSVLAVTFSRDGKRIVAGCRDGTVRVYDGTPLVEPGVSSEIVSGGVEEPENGQLGQGR